MTKEVFAVKGMSCAHCEGRINDALNAIDGVKNSKASAKKAEVSVKYDENKVSLADLKAAVNALGYEA